MPQAIDFLARGILRSGDSILLCRNEQHGYFYLPGGHIEPGEPAAAAIAREFLEETGLIIVATELLLTSENLFDQGGTPRHELNLVFHVEHPRAKPPAEVHSREPEISFHWIDLAAIADLDLRPLEIKAWLVSGAGTTWLAVTGGAA